MKRKRKNSLLFLILLLLGITIGFAALATTLKINGTTNINKNTWDVYWDNPVVNQSSVNPSNVPLIGKEDEEDDSNTNVTWSATLDKPGDFYEFTVDAVNNGSLDAMISDIKKSATPTLPSYIKYEITYADGAKIKKNHILPKKTNNTPTVETYKVRVEYDRNAVTNSDINNQESTDTYTFNFEVKYSQADENARDRHISMYVIDRQVEGEITQGDLACTGNVIGEGECFYIMSNENGIAKLLPKYNLNISEATETVIKQSTSYTDKDYIAFSQTNYYSGHESEYPYDNYNKPYVYNDLTYAKDYIDKYKNYLTTLGLDINEARLLRYDELIDDFGCDGTTYAGDACAAISQYTGNQGYASFWIGSVYNYDSLYRVTGTTLWINMYNASNANGVRPIIIIDSSEL